MTVGWFSGKYENDRDASDANTISDKEYRAIQARAVKANPERAKVFSKEGVESRVRDTENRNNRWWN